MKKGDKIICINDKDTSCPIKEGMLYIINDVYTCPTCGMVEYKLSIPYTGKNGMICASCKHKVDDNVWYAEHWRFKKLEEDHMENTNLNVEFKSITKKQPIIAN